MTTKERKEDKRLRKLYGVSLSWRKRQERKQNNRCAICTRPPKRLALALDHNHATLKVRGLLCFTCNRKIIGMIERFRINPVMILKYFQDYDPDALKYLAENNGNLQKNKKK